MFKRSGVVVAAAFGALAIVAACRGKEAGAYDGPYADTVTEVIPKIEESIGLRFKTPPVLEVRSQAQVRQFLEAQFAESGASQEVEGQERAYKRLGMLPDTLDVKRLYLDLLAEQIVGYYDPKQKKLFVVESAPKEMAGMTVSHELIHALQDQYYDLDSLQAVKGANDRSVAAQAVIEGQAVYEQMATSLGGDDNFAVRLPGGWDRIRSIIRENQSSMPRFAAAPMVVQETLLFPYLSGAEFMRAHKQRKKGVPYADMPQSTEQILHPERFFQERDAPTAVTLPVPAGATQLYANTLGEFETRLFLFAHLRDQGASVRGAAGWDGDRYQVLRTASGAEALAWVSVWDSAVEAGEFYDQLDRVVQARFAPKSFARLGEQGKRYRVGDRTVEVRAGEVAGRPAVLYVDGDVTLDLARVTVEQ